MASQRNTRIRPPLNQRGVTLVELMVAMVIGLFLVGAVGIIYVNTSNSSRASTLEAQMNEDAALALELLQQQIRLTGYSNLNTADNTRRFTGTAVFGCDQSFASTNASFGTVTCNAGTGSDSLAVRYEATTLNSQVVGVNLPGNCANEGINTWDASGEGGVANMALADNRYYIADDADGRPALTCRGRTGAGFGTETALIPNIEDMQVEYAITALPEVDKPIPHQVVSYVDASNAALGATQSNWSRVAAIRICLLVRSAEEVPAGENSLEDVLAYRDCNGDWQNPDPKTSARFLRRTYATTVQLRNMRPALPADVKVGEPTPPNPWAFLYQE